MEFPAVTQSRIEFWKKPQYNRKSMWWFTLIFGFFGIHHLMLRSPQTAFIFFFANFFLLGYPWFYDLIQLSHKDYSGLGTEGLNKYGMGHILGPLGMGQGMWLPEDQPAPPRDPATDPPNPWFFMLYCLTIPIGIIACMIAGDPWNALTRFIFLVIMPLGTIFTLIYTLYDMFNVLLRPANVLMLGIKRPFPFAPFFMHMEGHSHYLTGGAGNEIPSFPGQSWFGSISSIGQRMKSGLGSGFSWFKSKATTLGSSAIQTAKSTVETAKSSGIGQSVQGLAGKVTSATGDLIKRRPSLSDLTSGAKGLISKAPTLSGIKDSAKGLISGSPTLSGIKDGAKGFMSGLPSLSGSKDGAKGFMSGLPSLSGSKGRMTLFPGSDMLSTSKGAFGGLFSSKPSSPSSSPIFGSTPAPSAPSPILGSAPAPAPSAPAETPTPVQAGGGSFEKTPLDYFAMSSIVAVIGGSLLLMAGRTIANVGQSDNEYKGDLPPNPRYF